jgi:hypothetical protein
MRFGAMRMVDNAPVALKPSALGGSPISTAFSCNIPLVETVQSTMGEQVTYLSGVLGSVKKVGILYLEIHGPKTAASHLTDLTVFKAVRQAFHDVLKLS